MGRRYLALLTMLVLGLSCVVPAGINGVLETPGLHEEAGLYRTSYVAHAPFNITSNVDFETLGFPGNGSEAEPYLIQDLNITSTGPACIWVMNTSSHFIIQDCLFESPMFHYLARHAVYPVTLTNVSNGEVRGNHFVESFGAFAGYKLSNCTITENVLSVSYHAIIVLESNSTTISDNTQGYEPVNLAATINSCRNCTITRNVFKNVTSSGFYVRNCYDVHLTENNITGATGDLVFTWSGIELYGGQSCSIVDNVVTEFGLYGIDVDSVDCLIAGNNVTSSDTCMKLSLNNSVVRDNWIGGGFYGMALVQANDSSFHENTIFGRSGYYEAGIAVHGGTNCDIFSNNISRVGYGIYLQGCDGFNVSGNRVTDGRYGFAFGWYSNWNVPEGPFSHCDIIGNVFGSGGVYPLVEYYSDWEFDTITFEGNTVNGGDIGFFAEASGDSVNGGDFSQLVLVSCNGVTVSGGEFAGILSDKQEPYYDPGQASAIILLNCSGCSLDGLSFHDNTIGVNLQDCADCNVTASSGDLNTWRGISISHSARIRISGVAISNSLRGIEISSSHNCQVSGATITQNEEGVVLRTSYSCLLSGSMYFENGDAILLDDSDGTELRGNDVYWNERGILLNSTSDCLITENHVYNNTGVGICLSLGSNLNDIFSNVFAFNSPNAICLGTSNHWDNMADTGNQWSDYGGEGPYVIDENDQDNYPSVIITTTTSTTGNGGINPLILGIGGGMVGLIALIIVVVDRRRVRVVD